MSWIDRRKLHKIFIERLTEPAHLNLLSLFVWPFGTYRMKVNFDLIIRQQYAFPILYAADLASRHGIRRLTLIEFGVANGDGLRNMCRIANRTTKATGVEFNVVGFDTGMGMPPPIDYRDLPEVWHAGMYKMNQAAVQSSLPNSARLILGDVKQTVPAALSEITADAPIGFIALDVDYYSSAKSALAIFNGKPEQYLPLVSLYLDDIDADYCTPWTGELLAVNEFNQQSDTRKIAPFTLLRSKRIFKNTQWIDRMYAAHIHDHPLKRP